MTPRTMSSEPPTKETGARRGKAREDAIIVAVFELIGEIGYERITVDQIATRAKASKATMYNRWPGGKAELVADALRRNAEGREFVVADTGSIRGDLLAAVGDIANAVIGIRGGPSLIGLVECVRDDAMLRDIIRSEIYAANERVGLIICQRAIDRNERPVLRSAALVLHAATAEVLLQALLTGSPPAKGAQRRIVDDLLIPVIDPSAATNK